MAAYAGRLTATVEVRSLVRTLETGSSSMDSTSTSVAGSLWRQLIGRLGGGRGHRTFAGTPEQVAEVIAHPGLQWSR